MSQPSPGTPEPHTPTPNGLWPELYAQVWTRWLKPYFDVRAYFWQRRLILEHPDLKFSPEVVSAKEWKSPLAFALQGTAVSILLVNLLDGVFPLFFYPPAHMVYEARLVGPRNVVVDEVTLPPGQSVSQFTIEQDEKHLEILKDGLRRVLHAPTTGTVDGPIPYSERDPMVFATQGENFRPRESRAKAVEDYKKEIATVGDQLTADRDTDTRNTAQQSVFGVLRNVLPVVLISIPAYFFSLFSRIGRGSYEARGREHEYYLYYLSSRMIFLSLALSAVSVMWTNLDLYLPQPIVAPPAAHRDDFLYITLQYRSSYFFCAELLLFIWSYITIRSIARALLPAFGLKPAPHVWNMYSGEKKMRKDIFAAALVSSLALNLLIFGALEAYVRVGPWLNSFRIRPSPTVVETR